MKCIIIFGPPAAGKMTVGRAIAEKTGYKLFHNHMSIDLLLNFFEFGTPSFRKLDNLIWFSIMKEVAKSDHKGFIFTFMWCFEKNGKETDDIEYIRKIEKIFADEGVETVFLELECSLEKRLVRNKGELRLEHKPSKRNIEYSERMMKENDLEYRLNSKEGELGERRHVKINNENALPDEVADIAIKKLAL